MKKNLVMEFIRRGLVACGLGPVVLAVLYLILQRAGSLQMLGVNEVCTGIFSLLALAFIAGGLNALYQLERLPLMVAILIHGSILYVSYLGTFLVNGWLEWGTAPILVFSGIFVVGYLVIWGIIYSIIKTRTERLNKLLEEKAD